MRPRSPRDQLVRRALAVALSAALAGLLGGCGLLPRPHIERVTIIPASLGTSSRAVESFAIAFALCTPPGDSVIPCQ